MADVTIFFGGYNSITQTYNSGGYNQDVGFTGLSGSVGSVVVAIAEEIDVTGLAGTSAVGSVTIGQGEGITVELTGVAATGSAGVINIWGSINDSQTPNWSAISDSQTPSWSAVSDSQTPNWTEIAA